METRPVIIYCYNNRQRKAATEIFRLLKKKKMIYTGRYISHKEAKEYGSRTGRYMLYLNDKTTDLPTKEINAIEKKYNVELDYYDDEYINKKEG